MKKRKWLIGFSALVLLAGLLLIALDTRLITRHYTVRSEKIASPVRLAVLSDLHGCDFGGEHLASVAQETPDAVLIAGDWFADSGDFAYETALLRDLAARWPTYYVLGNHEQVDGWLLRILDIAEECGVQLLLADSARLDVNGQSIRICGIPGVHLSGAPARSTMEELAALTMETAGDEFTLLLAHRPEEISHSYVGHGFDLVVSGHAHGGQVRVPGLLNGLWAPNQGWFPQYAGGEYLVGDTRMIVSRGMETGLFPPRIFNRPEVVVIDLVGY